MVTRLRHKIFVIKADTDEKTMVFRTEYKGALLDRELIRTCSALLAVEQILIFLG